MTIALRFVADNISSVALTNETSSEDYLYAHCLVKPQSSEAAAIDGQSVRGSVMFRQLVSN